MQRAAIRVKLYPENISKNMLTSFSWRYDTYNLLNDRKMVVSDWLNATSIIKYVNVILWVKHNSRNGSTELTSKLWLLTLNEYWFKKMIACEFTQKCCGYSEKKWEFANGKIGKGDGTSDGTTLRFFFHFIGNMYIADAEELNYTCFIADLIVNASVLTVQYIIRQ